MTSGILSGEMHQVVDMVNIEKLLLQFQHMKFFNTAEHRRRNSKLYNQLKKSFIKGQTYTLPDQCLARPIRKNEKEKLILFDVRCRSKPDEAYQQKFDKFYIRLYAFTDKDQWEALKDFRMRDPVYYSHRKKRKPRTSRPPVLFSLTRTILYDPELYDIVFKVRKSDFPAPLVDLISFKKADFNRKQKIHFIDTGR